MTQRWTVDGEEPFEDETGEFVHYSDYEKLLEALRPFAKLRWDGSIYEDFEERGEYDRAVLCSEKTNTQITVQDFMGARMAVKDAEGL